MAVPLNHYSLMVQPGSTLEKDLYEAYQASPTESELLIHTLVSDDFEHLHEPNCACAPFYIYLRKPHITFPEFYRRFRCYATEN